MIDHLVIRKLDPENELVEISRVNALLRTAYRIQEAEDVFAAAEESVEATRRRIKEGECLLAFLGEELVGCLVLRTNAKASAPDWYKKPGVASFGRFAVDPGFRNQGIGSSLLGYAEQRAKELGFSELALDTSENAKQLMCFYKNRGYERVSHHQWKATTFKSVVFSKML